MNKSRRIIGPVFLILAIGILAAILALRNNNKMTPDQAGLDFDTSYESQIESLSPKESHLESKSETETETEVEILTGWQEDEFGKFYLDDTGEKILSKEETIDGKTFYFDRLGYVDQSQDIIPALIDKYSSAFVGDFEVYYYDLDRDLEFTTSSKRIYPASLTKLMTMGLIYDSIDKGYVSLTDETYYYLDIMIRASDNNATNHLSYMIQNAYPDVNVADKYLEFAINNGFNDTIVHPYFAADFMPELRYPININPAMTVRDAGQFMAKVYKGQMVSEEASKAMLDLLHGQERTSKIPSPLPEGTWTANKTGEYDVYSHDAAIIKSPRKDYVLAVMTENKGGDPGDYSIRDLSREIYEAINGKSLENSQ